MDSVILEFDRYAIIFCDLVMRKKFWVSKIAKQGSDSDGFDPNTNFTYRASERANPVVRRSDRSAIIPSVLSKLRKFWVSKIANQGFDQ